MSIIYLATNTVNGKVYIGQTIQTLRRRMRGHRTDTYNSKKKDTAFHRAIKKYGWDNFDWIVLEELPEEELDEAEKFWIAYNNFFKLPHYNMTAGGDGTIGYKAPEEVLLKMRLRKPPSRLGIKQSEETKLKRANSNSKTVTLISPEGTETIITNVAQFCRDHNLNSGNMCHVIKGRRKSYHGWRKL